MRVSIVNCVSTAYDMMRFSDLSLLQYARHANFDYIVVKWLASRQVEKYLADELPEAIIKFSPIEGVCLHVVEYETNSTVGYVPNLRAMMNAGFDLGFRLNEYCGLVNTDCYFGPGWLKALARRAKPTRVINSLHITAATPPKPVQGIITEDLGSPLPGKFNTPRFVRLYDTHYKNQVTIAPPDDYRQCATMPYLFHRDYWQRCGPWELSPIEGEPPDVRFFNRIKQAGAEFALAHDSIVYHHEAVERRGKRPKGAERLPEE
jgi:hypothetical protein